MRHLRPIRILEFLIVGVLFNIFDNLLSINFATNERINLRVIFIVLLVAIPFAFISEIIVDHPRFWQVIFRRKKS